MNKYYTGIGSRTTPVDILHIMSKLAIGLAKDGWVLRSGGANGADTAFEQGCDFEKGSKEIFLPWKNFNNNPSPFYTPYIEARNIAEKYHPNFKYLKEPVKLLHTRNVHQILGHNLFGSPISKFVVCWTTDGCEDGTKTTKKTGGSGQALRIATAYNVPIFNLKNDDSLNKVVEFVSQLK